MKKYRLITYNIHKGIHPLRSLNVIDRLRIALVESRADFLLLQEVVGERKERAKVERQMEALADERWPYHAYGKNAVFPTRNHGNAILSSMPIKKFHNFDLTVYPVEMRGLLHAEVDFGGRSVHLCSVHLDLFEFTRRRQIEAMIGYLKETVPAKEPLILGGDFNDWARKAGPRLRKALQVEEQTTASFPAWRPMVALDRLYVRGIKPLRFEALGGTPWNRLSDHLPLALEFRF
jgi:endonuclease/exonuclease/phosphatase family metal-dependent hydrolase